jgi:hypothetical protein
MPHEFIRATTGFLYKADCGHDCDHTVIGAQSLLWDLAGAAVEWNLNAEQTHTILRAADVVAPAVAFDFHRAAYAAFRVGMLTLLSSHSGESMRTEAAKQFYTLDLEHTLGMKPSSDTQLHDVDRLNNGCEIVHAHGAD